MEIHAENAKNSVDDVQLSGGVGNAVQLGGGIADDFQHGGGIVDDFQIVGRPKHPLSMFRFLGGISKMFNYHLHAHPC